MIERRPRETGARRRVPAAYAGYVARTVIEFGDECARIAAAWLVFSQTSSVPLTALAYLLMAAPAIVFGQARAAGRLPRGVPVALDLTRTSLLASLAWAGLPPAGWWVAVTLFGLAVRYRAATWPQPPESPSGPPLWPMVSPYIRLSGFVTGGLLSMAVGPRPVLGLGAAVLGLGALLATSNSGSTERMDATVGARRANWNFGKVIPAAGNDSVETYDAKGNDQDHVVTQASPTRYQCQCLLVFDTVDPPPHNCL